MAVASIQVSETPLVLYVLRRADDALILGHRLSEWCGHAPMLEEDMALANFGLDLIGRSLLACDGRLQGRDAGGDWRQIREGERISFAAFFRMGHSARRWHRGEPSPDSGRRGCALALYGRDVRGGCGGALAERRRYRGRSRELA